jgi:hypothetical protein
MMVFSRGIGAPYAGSANQYNGDPRNAYAHVDVRNIPALAALHEWGHNNNANHQFAKNVCPEGNGVDVASNFVTVMDGQGTVLKCPSVAIPQFSNPRVKFAPTSNPGEVNASYPTGDATHNNAARIRAVALRVSQFR